MCLETGVVSAESLLSGTCCAAMCAAAVQFGQATLLWLSGIQPAAVASHFDGFRCTVSGVNSRTVLPAWIRVVCWNVMRRFAINRDCECASPPLCISFTPVKTASCVV